MIAENDPASYAADICMQGTQDLWTFYADSVVHFEQKMSILQGIYIDDTQMDNDGECCLHKSCKSLYREVCYT